MKPSVPGVPKKKFKIIDVVAVQKRNSRGRMVYASVEEPIAPKLVAQSSKDGSKSPSKRPLSLSPDTNLAPDNEAIHLKKKLKRQTKV
jgi:hypothetical protein